MRGKMIISRPVLVPFFASCLIVVSGVAVGIAPAAAQRAVDRSAVTIKNNLQGNKKSPKPDTKKVKSGLVEKKPNGPVVPVGELRLNARQIPLGGALKTRSLWQQYKARFITAQGRVIDSANNMISHSEGQGYGMLLAVAANDRETFDRIWGWTRANLLVRDDKLAVWRWEPGGRPAVSDMNNATDGDILIAWALAEAAELWAELSYRVAGRRIAVEVGRKLVLYKQKPGAIILPAIYGFGAEDRKDGPIINLSYYVFPAFARLPLVAPEYDWPGLTQAGLDFIKLSQFGESGLPTDWISVQNGKVSPAKGFKAQFSYNAVRIPLYMAWAGIGDWEHYEKFFAWGGKKSGGLSVVDVKTGKNSKSFADPGFKMIGTLLRCLPSDKNSKITLQPLQSNQHYYPSTLHLLSVIAIQMRYASCIRG